MSTYFTSQLLKWNESTNDRPMPWKGEKDPYKIWLSEIILQQTRVEQGWAYYEKFVQHFPTIQDLAKAKDEKVFKLWEGLGYYNRCRNLLFTARHIVKTYKGNFPETYDSLLTLKGVGPYTASAIASFAFNLPYAVVDGNVFRVLARFYGIHTPTDTKEGLMQFNTLAQQNLSKKEPGVYNQALMDFGATVCKPMAPICASCVLQSKCMAFNQNLVNQLPVKLKFIQKKKRYFDFFIFTYKDQVLIQKRQEQDIWRDLYQFYLVENERIVVANDFYFKEVLVDQLSIPAKNTSIVAGSAAFQQQLTHQLLQARFFTVHLTSIPRVFSKALWVKRSAIKKYPFPKIIHQYLEVHGVGVK